ncbi:MAG TPA: glycosyl hydrolase 108 family protein [Anaerovoracaceae bacterium]|nr:glycosyl hydrolase 108 family protein [Anaerovoracaceae bacterium]
MIKNSMRKEEVLEGTPGTQPTPPTEAPAPKPVEVKPGSDRFKKALAYTFKNEGGFSNIPEDHGGATNFGIIREELARWRHTDVTPEDVKNMKREEAEAIYKAWYWNPLNLDRIDAENVAIALFDRGVLNGLTGVSRHVKNVLGRSQDEKANFDSCIDEINSTNPIAFVMRLADQCEAKHRANVAAHPDQKKFLMGWLNRVNRMRKELGDGTTRPT